MNDAQNLLSSNDFRRISSLGGAGSNYGQGLSGGMNPSNSFGPGGLNKVNSFSNAAARQDGMNQYMSNLNKGFSGSELDNANIQKYLPYLLNSGANNLQDMLGSMDQRMGARDAQQGNAPSGTNPAGGFSLQSSLNAGLPGSAAGNARMMAETQQKQVTRFQLRIESLIL